MKNISKPTKKAENIRKMCQAWIILMSDDSNKTKVVTPDYLAEISGISNPKTVIDILREYEPLIGLGIKVRETTGGKIVAEYADLQSPEEINKKLKNTDDKLNKILNNLGIVNE